MLTAKQERFKEAKVAGEADIDAARIAYCVNGKLIDDHTLSTIAYENMRKHEIVMAIDKHRAELSAEMGVTIAGQVAEHRRLAKIAEEKGDLTTATANLVYVGKTVAAYADKNINIGEKTVIIISPKGPKQVESEVIEPEKEI